MHLKLGFSDVNSMLDSYNAAKAKDDAITFESWSADLFALRNKTDNPDLPPVSDDQLNDGDGDAFFAKLKPRPKLPELSAAAAMPTSDDNDKDKQLVIA